MVERSREIKLAEKQIKDKTFASRFAIQPERIGNLLGYGLNHRVYEYENDWVIKIPRGKKWHLPESADIRRSDAEVIHAYFPDYYIETIVIEDNDAPYYCYIQKKLNRFVDLTSSALEVDEVRAQFEDLISINHTMMKEYGASLDFLGWDGFKKSKKSDADISNVVVELEPTPRLVIVDAALLRYKLHASTYEIKPRIERVLAHYATQRVSRALIKSGLGYDIGKI